MSTADHLHRGEAQVAESTSSSTTTVQGQRVAGTASNDDIARAAIEARKGYTAGGGGIEEAAAVHVQRATAEAGDATADRLAARRGPPAPRARVAAGVGWLAPSHEPRAALQPEPTWVR